MTTKTRRRSPSQTQTWSASRAGILPRALLRAPAPRSACCAWPSREDSAGACPSRCPSSGSGVAEVSDPWTWAWSVANSARGARGLSTWDSALLLLGCEAGQRQRARPLPCTARPAAPCFHELENIVETVQPQPCGEEHGPEPAGLPFGTPWPRACSPPVGRVGDPQKGTWAVAPGG